MAGRIIHDWRTDMGWTQKQLATALGKTQSYVSQLEAGKMPQSIDSLRRISKVTGFPIDELRPETSSQ